MTKPQHLKTKAHPRTLIIGIEAPYNRLENIQAYYEEFLNLLKTSDIEYDESLFLKLREINPRSFISPGRLDSIRELCKKNNIAEVIISEPLTAPQAKNLENYLDCKIFDRTDLILDIFRKSAKTAEGKKQVEIATFEHEKTRLAGKGIFLEQQRSGSGIKGKAGAKSGFGETLKEREKRIYNAKIQQLKKELEHLQKARDTQRKQRLTTQVPQICLIGYTNAGKSTILNQLTHADVLAEDKLFATLDTTTRELYINGKKKGVLSDTVGFIQFLPHQLIEAFKSTLSELKDASLLIEVIDASDPACYAHIEVVQDILNELEVSKPILYVFNKIDKLPEEAHEAFALKAQKYQPHVIVSAKTKERLKPLIDYLATWNVEQKKSS